MATVGIVSPGAMGSAIGRVLADGGARVVATTCRAQRAHRSGSRTGSSCLPAAPGRRRGVGDRALCRPAGRGALRSRRRSARPPPRRARARSSRTSTPSRRRRRPTSRRASPERGSRRSTARSPGRRHDGAGTTVVYLSGPAAGAGRRPSPRPGSTCASSARRSGRRRRSRCRRRPSTRASRRSSRRRSGRLGRTACSSSCSTISGAAFPTSSATRRGCSRASRRSPVATSPRWRRSPQTQAAAGLTPDLFAAYADDLRRV